jgi:hypothetical protein
VRTPFEESLAAALQARLAGGDPARASSTLSLGELVIDLPAGRVDGDPGDLAEAIAVALVDLLREPR